MHPFTLRKKGSLMLVGHSQMPVNKHNNKKNVTRYCMLFKVFVVNFVTALQISAVKMITNIEEFKCYT
jgi:hypothetical protein